IPMAWISFRFLNLTEGLTGGLLKNIDEAIIAATGQLGGFGTAIEVLAGAFIGLALIFLFPIHWCIFYRSEDIGLIIAVTFPWILCCVIISGIFAHSPKGGIHSSLAIGIGYAILLAIPYLALSATPIGPILDGLLLGLSDLPYLVAVLTAILEGSFVGAVFGGFIGSLKYNPGRIKKSKPKSKGKEEVAQLSDVNIAIERSIMRDKTICANCGAKLASDDVFCTNCGAKR
ncbi:MAG: zinc ribbon domain-containing protein, partial [Candidatus Thorarchaeota archaeon]